MRIWGVVGAVVAAAVFATTPARAVDLLVSSGFGNSILKYDGITGAYIGVFAQGGGLIMPSGLVEGPNGDIFVCSYGTSQILRYERRTGAFLGVFASGGGLDSPMDLAFGPDGNLYVTSIMTHAVLRYQGTTGAFLGAFVPSRSGDLFYPSGLTFGPDHHLYVVGFGNDDVLRFNGTTGAFMGNFTTAHNLQVPTDAVFGPDGGLYVSDEYGDKVYRYNGTTGQFLGAFAGGSELDFPYAHTFGPDGNLYVCVLNQNTDSVYRYSGQTGQFLGPFTSGQGPNGSVWLLFHCDRDATFTDVPCTHWAWRFIEAVAAAGIASGFGDGSYQPNSTVNRGAMAVFMARTVDRVLGSFAAFSPPPCGSESFSDLACSHPFYKFVEYVVSNGIASGFPDGTYKPGNPVSRSAMAIFLSRVRNVSDGDLVAFSPPPCGSETFPDVPCTHPSYRFIEYIAEKGIASGFGDGNFRPTTIVTRAAMAVFITRAANLPL